MAVALRSQVHKSQNHQVISQSESFTGAWASLFSSFSEQQALLQRFDEAKMPQILAQAVHKPPTTTATAVHQSAVFAALFEDMINAQSVEALVPVQQPHAISEHSSAVSLCDSATSFSFKTARNNHHADTDRAPERVASQQPVALEPERMKPDLEKAALSVTLKDWEIADAQSGGMSMDAGARPQSADKPVSTSLLHSTSQQALSNRQHGCLGSSNSTQFAPCIPTALLSTVQTAGIHHDNRLAQPVRVRHSGKGRQANRRPQHAFRGAQPAQQSICIVELPCQGSDTMTVTTFPLGVCLSYCA